MVGPISTHRLISLAGQVQSLLSASGHPLLLSWLAEWPQPSSLDRSFTPTGLQVLIWLEQLPRLASAITKPIVEELTAIGHGLQWRQSYQVADFGAEFLESYGWTEMIGERGPLASEHVAAGFLMLAPDTIYPDHSHQAEEIYVPLAGRAQWRKHAEDWRVEQPGAIVHHAPWVRHATRTRDEPLLALYVWRGGDLSQKPVIGSG